MQLGSQIVIPTSLGEVKCTSDQAIVKEPRCPQLDYSRIQICEYLNLRSQKTTRQALDLTGSSVASIPHHLADLGGRHLIRRLAF